MNYTCHMPRSIGGSSISVRVHLHMQTGAHSALVKIRVLGLEFQQKKKASSANIFPRLNISTQTGPNGRPNSIYITSLLTFERGQGVFIYKWTTIPQGRCNVYGETATQHTVRAFSLHSPCFPPICVLVNKGGLTCHWPQYCAGATALGRDSRASEPL